jgi:hypothetical protein
MKAVIHHRQIAAGGACGRGRRRIGGRARHLPAFERLADPGFEPAGVTRLAYDVRGASGAQLREEIAGAPAFELEAGRKLHQEYREFFLQTLHLVEEPVQRGSASLQAQFMSEDLRHLHREPKLARHGSRPAFVGRAAVRAMK